jgi:hypothetical protein
MSGRRSVPAARDRERSFRAVAVSHRHRPPLPSLHPPLAGEGLRDAIVALMARVGLRAEGVYQINAGIQSTHSNAYFTGVGTTKRIVLYDSLRASHPR